MRLPTFDRTPSPRVLVIGDLMLDRYLWGSCDRVSPEAPVQVVQVQRETYSLGGAGNVVANLRSLGADTALIALLGADAAGETLEKLLREQGVDTAGLVRDPTRPTTVKTRVLAAHHQLLRFDVERTTACSDEQAAAILTALQLRAADTKAVILSDYGKGVLTKPLVSELIRSCRALGLPVLIDPKGRDYGHYRGATLLTPNRKEAAAATGLTLKDDNHIAAAGRQLLQELDLSACLITLSEDGMALFEPQGVQRLPTQAREVFDVTGAGDTVIAAIAFGLSCELSMLEACQFANRAAGVVVGKLGAATVTLDELADTETPSQQRERDPASKVMSLDRLLSELARLRAGSRARRIVFTNGCFDILHAGHVQYLSQAARLGDVLIVGLNSDDSVRRLKGPTRPINTEQDRALLLAGLSAVSYVTTFAQDTPFELINALLPDVLVKGGDYRAEDIIGGDIVRAKGGCVTVLPFVAGHSTTNVIARATQSSAENGKL